MTEAQRILRNIARLSECDSVFAAKLRRVLTAMEGKGYRPRIQDAWRSPADELSAYQSGHSQVKRGFHSCTGPNGEKQALAADVLDDDAPLTPRTSYLLALAWCARAEGLQTGILWGLADSVRQRINVAIEAQTFDAKLPIGFDPTHVEIAGISIHDALAGARPETDGP